jgi:hypothetical protein
MHKLSGPKAILNGVEVISATLNSIKWALLKQREDWLQRESCNFKLTTASDASFQLNLFCDISVTVSWTKNQHLLKHIKLRTHFQAEI